MPDPIPTNRNVRQGQQSQHIPVPPAQQPIRLRPIGPQHSPVPPRYHPAPARPVPARTDVRRNPWEHRVAALVVGTALFGAVVYYIDSLFTQSPDLVNHLWGSVQLGSYTYTLTTGSFLIALLFAIPLFFGAAYGPWVGLLVAAIGSLAGDFIGVLAFSFTFDWHWDIGIGLMGFFASLAPFRTRRRYPLLITTFIASIVGALAIAIGIGGTAFSVNWSLNATLATDLFVNFAPEALVALIFFSFLLYVYNAIVSRR